jgi:sarcosine oxidase delta subunit
MAMKAITPILTETEITEKAQSMMDFLEQSDFPMQALNETYKTKRCENFFEFLRQTINYQFSMKRTIFDNMTVEDLTNFKNLFYFYKTTLHECRRELYNYVIAYQQFRGTTLNEIYNKMAEVIPIANDQYDPVKFTYINTIPDYGGQMKDWAHLLKPKIHLLSQTTSTNEPIETLEEHQHQTYLHNLQNND